MALLLERWRILMIFVIGLCWMIDNVYCLKIFNCDDSESLCSSVNICPNNEDCLINCIGDNSCRDKTFQCPGNGQCLIQCGSNINDTNSCYQTLFTTKSNTKIISISAFGTNSLKYSTVFCPHNDNVCFIYSMDGHSQLSNINIYTSYSHHNVNIYCKYPSKCYNLTQYPIIHCSEISDYTESCNIDLTSNSFDKWQCIDQNSICNQIDNGTPKTTKTPNPTSNPTSNPTPNPTNNYLSPITSSNLYKINISNSSNHTGINTINDHHTEGIIIGSIFVVTFVSLFILVCIIAIYLKQSKTRKLAKKDMIGRRISNLPLPPPPKKRSQISETVSEIDLNREILMIDRKKNRDNNKNNLYLSKPPSNFSSRQVSDISIAGRCKKCLHRTGQYHHHHHHHHHNNHHHDTRQNHDLIGEDSKIDRVTIPIERSD